MTLSPQFLDELRARTTLSTLVGRTTKLQKAGREYRACCPFHNEKTPSFYVNDDKGFYHCFSADTKVITRSGRREIGDLADQSAEVLSRDGQWKHAAFKAYGKQQLWRIDLSRNGMRKTILATSGHRWFVNGRASDVVTAELRQGHALLAALPAKRTDWTLDPSGIRHGVVFGDGTMYQGVYGTVNLHGGKDAALAQWFPDQQHHAHERTGGKSYLRVYGGRTFEGFKELPDIAMPDAYLLGFLAGYLAADGHVAKDGTVMLNSADADALEAVRDIALRLGIATYGRTTLMRTGFGTAPSALHRIHFVTSTLAPTMFLLDQARTRFAERAKAFDRLRWVVRSVEPTDRIEQVFCAEVPDGHAFTLEDNILTGNCFGCSAHGDAIRWMTDQRGLPFMDAVKELAQAAGMELPAMDPRAAEQAEAAKGLHEACADAAAWFTNQLNGLAGADARDVLAKRGITPETARAFGLGFAPDTRGGLKAALKDYGDALLVEAGLLVKVDDKAPYDRFRGRLMIPIRDQRGRTIAFGGRVIGAGEPKYLNSPETPLFDKGRTLYNLDRAAAPARKAGRVIVVEGYMDVIALAQAGFGEVVAPLGTALTEAQLERLWRMADVPVLCFDGDAAGQKAALRAAHRALPVLTSRRSLSFITLPPGQDPDDLVRSAGAAAFETLVREPQPLIDRLWQHELAATTLYTPEQRAGLKQRLQELAGTIEDPIVRREYEGDFRNRCYEHFAVRRRPAAPFTAARPGKRGANGQWKQPIEAPTQEAKAVHETGIDPILAKAVLAGLIRHPVEIARHMEVLGSLRIADGTLARLFEAVVDLAVDQDSDGQTLDSEDLRTILAKSGFGDLASELLRADRMPYSFTRSSGDPVQARSDLDEAIAVMVAGPEVDAALERATAACRRELSDAAFTRQVALVRERQALEERLANLMQAHNDEQTLGSEAN